MAQKLIVAGEGTMCGQNDLSIRHFKNEKARNWVE